MIVIVDITLVKDIVTIVGALIAFTYYIMTVSNSNKARKTQILSQAYSSFDEESWSRFLELMEMEWNDYDEFEKKYGSDNNPENYAKRMSEFSRYENVGILLKNGLIEVDAVYELYGTFTRWLWTKFNTIIYEQRVRYMIPEVFQNFEYLYDEIIRLHKQRGYEDQVPETYTKYVTE